jgi:hypothetical protein
LEGVEGIVGLVSERGRGFGAVFVGRLGRRSVLFDTAKNGGTGAIRFAGSCGGLMRRHRKEIRSAGKSMAQE